jgi:hypothetical protein
LGQGVAIEVVDDRIGCRCTGASRRIQVQDVYVRRGKGAWSAAAGYPLIADDDSRFRFVFEFEIA